MSSPYRWGLRVYIEDTDAGGIVYYANYLKYAERARTEMLRAAGFAHGAIMAKERLFLAVRRCTVDYLRPARLDDWLEIETTIASVRRASIAFEQKMRRGFEAIASLTLLIACIGDDGKPHPLPAPLQSTLLTLVTA
ncbi:MAG TPA: tol-pal system-associated acyl-CoA thioesterase [Dongiaceae bacterium]|jgi:acyl-CoA thioester hydrolase|nr:tol-pal system-associated acyl-CoA thioesterase [Dongiaceae bacterium]